MSTYKRTLKDKDNNTIIPVTNTNAVFDGNGDTVDTLLAGKQEILVSGTNIKTINGVSILGGGDIVVGGAVNSVNSKTGTVVLDGTDINVDNTEATPVTIATALSAKYEKPSGGIPKTDLASSVQTSLGKADTALQSAPVTSVNGQTGAVTLSIPSGAAASKNVTDKTASANLGTSDTNLPTARAVTWNTVNWLNRTNQVSVANTNYTTYMARGEALVSSATNPTVNGTISWQYT